MVLFDLGQQPTEDSEEDLHRDATCTVGACRPCLTDTLLEQLLFRAVFVRGCHQTFDHVPEEGVDLVWLALTIELTRLSTSAQRVSVG